MLALVLSVLVASTSHGAAASSRSAHLPSRGVVVPGKAIGGVSLGLTGAAVRRRWGSGYTICQTCALPTWLYEDRVGEPLGAAVEFRHNRVVAVFTLGSPAGWGVKGAMMGDPIGNVYTLFPNTGTVNCIGYSALTVRFKGETMSFYSAAGVIYGYALTARSQPPCQ